MGKPYESELNNLNNTYQYSVKEPIDGLSTFINETHNLPLIVVGSGGSLTSAHMAAYLHQRAGTISKAVTPLELFSFGKSINDSGILILTAGGRNNDILSAFRYAAISEPHSLVALCMRKESPLSKLSKEFRYTSCFDFDLPSGKDGFLATNSLLATNVFLIRAYEKLFPGKIFFPESLTSGKDVYETLKDPIQPLINKNTWVVLYGGWGLPAAIDAESKFTEAALGHIQIADYRNFAHGRHHWLAKREIETGIIAIITPEEVNIAERTLDLLPKNIPILRLITDKKGPIGSLELFVKMLHLVYLVGLARGIDPGKPGVPAFGRKIYNLRTPSYKNALLQGVDSIGSTAIYRKSGYAPAEMIDMDLKYWKEAYREYIKKLENTIFGGVVFDYDGTLCDSVERFDGPTQEIGWQLIRLLENGIIVGIATGRGKSVRIDLQRLILKKYWDQVIIGYYNGADIAFLKDDDHPSTIGPIDATLESIKLKLKSHYELKQIANYEIRPKQITIEAINPAYKKRIRDLLAVIVNKSKLSDIRMLESSHSIDIIARGVSKLNLVRACEEMTKQIGNPGIALCIGDKGKWPGNDYELLSTPYSISVDTVSPDPMSCWNLNQAGHRGVQATIKLLESLQVLDNKGFSFSLKRRK